VAGYDRAFAAGIFYVRIFIAVPSTAVTKIAIVGARYWCAFATGIFYVRIIFAIPTVAFTELAFI